MTGIDYSKPIFVGKLRSYLGDYQELMDGKYRLSVHRENNEKFIVAQEDLDPDGTVWNVTPVQSFATERAAVEFAEA